MASRSSSNTRSSNVISNVVENGRPIGNLGDGEAGLGNADMTYVDLPPKAAMLHALEVPPAARRGGNTLFSPTCSPLTKSACPQT